MGGAPIAWERAKDVRTTYMDMAAGFFMKRFEGKPEFEESFFKIALEKESENQKAIFKNE